MQEIHELSNEIYGSYKIAEFIQVDDNLETAFRNTVTSVMHEIGLKSRVSRKLKPTTTVVDPDKRPAARRHLKTFLIV